MTTPALPSLPPELPALEGPGGSPLHAGPAGPGLFSLSGRRSSAWGVETRGVRQVSAGGWTLAAALATGLGPASGVVVGPSSVRRELIGSGGSVLETLLIPVDASGAALQWTRPVGSGARLVLRLEWSMAWLDSPARVGAPALTYELHPHGLRITAPAGNPDARPTALALLHPAPFRLDARLDETGVRIIAEVASEGGPVTLLLVGAAGPEDAARAARSLAGLRTQERRAEQASQEAREEGLTTNSGAGSLGDALDWAKVRTRGGVVTRAGGARQLRRGVACVEPSEPGREGSSADPPMAQSLQDGPLSPFDPVVEPAWLALGALAAGDREPAEVLLEGQLGNGYELLVAARYALWTGSAGALRRHRSEAQSLCDQLSRGGTSDPVLPAAARELADAWESSDRGLAQQLRSAASATAGARAARRLPMMGSAGPGDGGDGDARVALLRALLDPAPAPYRNPSRPAALAVERALRAWALWRAGDPEQGHELLVDHAGAGFRNGSGLWSETLDGSGCADHTASAALIPAALLFGALGASADAPVGRLHLAPRLPARWSAVSIGGIGVGDARVRMEFERSGPAHTFRITQDAGRIPLMLIFEPEVAEAGVAEVRVDGSPAELECSSGAGRSRTRVQLPLDSTRTVTLVGRGTPR